MGKALVFPIFIMKIYLGTKKFETWISVATFKEFQALLKSRKPIQAVYFDELDYDEEDGEILPLDLKDCAHHLMEHCNGKALPEIWIKKKPSTDEVEELVNHYNKSYKHNSWCILTE